MSLVENQKIFHVNEKARAQIPKEIKVFKPEGSKSSMGITSEVKWSHDYVVYKLTSVSPAKGYGSDYLEVIYEKSNNS